MGSTYYELSVFSFVTTLMNLSKLRYHADACADTYHFACSQPCTNINEPM